MASVASWADQVRTEADERWHYVNMPPEADCHYVPARDCPNGECVVGAIERQVAILRSKAPDDERLRALKYLIHFIGDVHQPLHAGHGEDKGGNTFQLQAYEQGYVKEGVGAGGLALLWELSGRAPADLAAACDQACRQLHHQP